MKKTAAIILVCIMVLLVGASFAAQPDQKATVMLEGFDDLTEEDINNPSGAVTEPDDHSSYNMGDGIGAFVDGETRQGLAMIPDYESEYGSYVLRSTYRRTGTEYGSEERVAAVREAWANADGFRFYVKNNIDDNVTLQVHMTINVSDLGEDHESVTLTSYLGTKMYNMHGEEEEVIFDAPETWKNTRFVIPWGFEGWIDIPLTIAGVDGNAQDGEYGWFFPEIYSEEEIANFLSSEQINFDNVKAGVQLDFRFVPWEGILDEENPSEYNIVIDSLQLYNNTDGEVTYLPDDGTPDLPEETPEPDPTDTPEETEEPSESAGSGQEVSATVPSDASPSSGTGGQTEGNNIWLIVLIVVIVVAAVIIIVAAAAKKKKKPTDGE